MFKWMSIFLLALVASTSCAAQNRGGDKANPVAAAKATPNGGITGKWTYRSYHNRPQVIVNEDASLALSLVFGEGVMSFVDGGPGVVKGQFDMGGGYLLDLEGTVTPGSGGSPPAFRIAGKGRAGTVTDGWEYDYIGYLAPTWPAGVDQVPAIVGTVLRAKPHGTSKAGYVASFIAAKQP